MNIDLIIKIPFELTSIKIFGVLIYEPITTITDLLVTAVCFYAFLKLGKLNILHYKFYFFIRYYFLSMAVATLFGGLIGHGFYYLFPVDESIGVSPWKLPGWLMSMISIALLERATIENARKLINPNVGRFFTWLNIIELLTFMTLTFSTLNFYFVEVHSAYGLLIVVGGFNVFIFYKTKSKASKLFIIAIVISAFSAVIFMNKLSLHKWFNYFDISHVFMAISAYFFYLGAKEELENPMEKTI